MYIIDDDERVRAALFVDVSGSIPPDIIEKHYDDLVATIRNLCGVDYEIHFVPFELCVVDACIYYPDTIHQMAKYPIRPGGGSDIELCWKYMRNQNLESCIIFTDGMIDFKTKPSPSIPFLNGLVGCFKDIHFLFHSGIKIHHPPYGTVGRI